VVLFKPPPNLAGLHSNHRIVPGRVIGWAVEQVGSDAALLQKLVMPVESMLDDVGEELFAAATAAKRRTGEDGFQFPENLRFVDASGERRPH